MRGNLTVRFSELFASTVEEHGAQWAFDHYVLANAMPEWEFRIWLSAWGWGPQGNPCA